MHKRVSRREDLDIGAIASGAIDGHVIERAVAERTLLVAFVVPGADASVDDVRTAIEQQAGRAVVCVPMAALPLTDDGGVDEERLASVPLFDDAALRAAEEALGPDAAVVLAESSPPLPRIHLRRALPDFESAAVAPRQRAPMSAGAAPSFCKGESLRVATGAPRTLTEALRNAARGSGAVVHVHEDRSTVVQPYAELVASAQRVAAGLRRLGVRAGDIVLLQLDDSARFFPGYWGCALAGAVVASAPVPPLVDSAAAAVEKLIAGWTMLGRPLVLTGSVRADALRAALPSSCVAVLDEMLAEEPDGHEHLASPDDPAIIMLTSGSTGAPKGVVLRHRNILTMTASVTQMLHVGPSDVMLNWFALNHVGSVCNASFLPLSAGATQVHVQPPVVLQDGLSWIDLMHEHRATMTWAPNFAYAAVNARLASGARHRQWDLSRLRVMVNAGEAVVSSVAREFLVRLAPSGLRPDAMKPMFGMTETCSSITCSLSFHRDGAHSEYGATPLGQPIPGAASRVVDRESRVVPEGTIGRFQLRCSSIFDTYYGRPDLTAAAFDGEWLETGDLGYMQDGQIVLTGREKDVIVLNGEKYSTQEIELLVDGAGDVERSSTAAVPVRDPNSGADRLAVFFHTRAADDSALADVLRGIQGRLAQRLGIGADYLIPIAPEEVPRTSIGKIQRPALRDAFDAGRYQAAIERTEVLAGGDATLPMWFHEPRWQRRAIAGVPCIAAREALVLGAGDLAGQVAFALQKQGLRSASDAELIVYIAPPGRRCEAELLQLAQRLGDRPVALRVVTTSAEAVLPGDEVSLAHATVSGLLRVIARELPRCDCRLIDVDAGATADVVVAELSGVSREPEVAYRNGARYVGRFAPMALVGGTYAIAERGTYLIAGGLGGVGRLVARELLTRQQARLLIVGRTPEAELPADAASVLRVLQQLGEVRYAAADLADEAALRAATGGVALDGVFHLAAESHDVPLRELTPALLERQLRAHVDGSRALASLLSSGALYVAFASVAALVGGNGVAAYAAGNAFRIRFNRELLRRGVRAYALVFSAWAETGLSRGVPVPLVRANGLAVVEPREAVLSMRVALWQEPGTYVIGLEASHPRTRPWMLNAAEPLQQLRAFVRDGGARCSLRDATGSVATVVPSIVPELPRLPDGTIDRAALAHNRLSRAIAPRDEVERQIASVWRLVLNANGPEPSIDDSFLLHGGTSLRAAQLLGGLRDRFGVTVPLSRLFEKPTIAGLAETLREMEPVPGRVESIARRRAEIEQLTPEQVKARLAARTGS